MDGGDANWGGRGSFFDPYNSNPGADFLTAADDLSLAETTGTSSLQLPRIVTCGDEMESLCRAEMSSGGLHTISGFPPMCLPIVRLLGGNHCCVDCGEEDQVRPRNEPSFENIAGGAGRGTGGPFCSLLWQALSRDNSGLTAVRLNIIWDDTVQ